MSHISPHIFQCCTTVIQHQHAQAIPSRLDRGGNRLLPPHCDPKLLDHSSWQVGTGGKFETNPSDTLVKSQFLLVVCRSCFFFLCMKCAWNDEMCIESVVNFSMKYRRDRQDYLNARILLEPWSGHLDWSQQMPYSAALRRWRRWFLKKTNQINHLLNALEKKHPYISSYLIHSSSYFIHISYDISYDISNDISNDIWKMLHDMLRYIQYMFPQTSPLALGQGSWLKAVARWIPCFQRPDLARWNWHGGTFWNW